MKKTMYVLLAIVGVLASCSNEEIVNHHPSASSEGRLVTFSLGVPGREPVTYAQVHEKDEYNIDHLDIFQFNTSGFVKVHSNVSTTPAPSGDHLAIKTVAQIELPQGSTGPQDFLFVANNNPNKMQEILSSISVGTPKNVFKEKLTKLLSDTDAKLVPSFLMTGEKSVDITSGGSLDLTGNVVYLTRVVARIDVGISLSSSTEKLTITKIELTEAPRSSYLFKKGSGESPSNSGKANYEAIDASSSPNLNSHFDNVTTSSYTSRYKKLFYLYERPLTEFDSKGTPTLHITGQYKKDDTSELVKVSYVVPFKQDVERNHLYTVILGVKPVGDKYETTAEIKTLKWEDEVIITTEEVQLFNFSPSNTDFTYDSDSRTMTLGTGLAKTYTNAFTVTSKYANDDLAFELVKTGPLTLPNNDWITATISSGVITIEVQANNEGAEREGVIWFKSSKDTAGNQLYGMKVVQPQQ